MIRDVTAVHSYFSAFGLRRWRIRRSRPRPDPDRHTLVFVGGLHRSGTTLVASLVAAHTDASGFRGTGVPKNEGQHLQDIYPTARLYGGPGRFALDPRSHLTEQSALAAPGNAARLFGQWARHWDLTRRVLVEKSPPNLVRARFLQALFPDARFVMVKRHPVSVSLSTQRWRPDLDVETLLEHWFAGWEVFEADRPSLRHVLVVRYEELVADPTGVLRSVGAFCGLESLDGTTEIDRSLGEETQRRWAELIRTKGSARFERLSERFGERAAQHGYDLDQLGPAVASSAG